jgi:hypothetical protein
MLANLKRILLTQYIGAIITAYTAVQGVLLIIGVVFLAISTAMQPREHSVYGGLSPRAGLDWDRVLLELIRAALHLAVAAGFIRWLYYPSKHEVPQEELEPAGPDGEVS